MNACRNPAETYSDRMKLISTGRINDAAAKVGEHAPMAATCCNACRACVQTNLIALGLAGVVGVGTWVSHLVKRARSA